MQKPNDQKGRRTLNAAGKADSPACSRRDTRLVIPPAGNRPEEEAALRQVIEDWLLPRLLEEFLAEKGITPKSRYAAKPSV